MVRDSLYAADYFCRMSRHPWTCDFFCPASRHPSAAWNDHRDVFDHKRSSDEGLHRWELCEHGKLGFSVAVTVRLETVNQLLGFSPIRRCIFQKLSPIFYKCMLVFLGDIRRKLQASWPKRLAPIGFLHYSIGNISQTLDVRVEGIQRFFQARISSAWLSTSNSSLLYKSFSVFVSDAEAKRPLNCKSICFIPRRDYDLMWRIISRCNMFWWPNYLYMYEFSISLSTPMASSSNLNWAPTDRAWPLETSNPMRRAQKYHQTEYQTHITCDMRKRTHRFPTGRPVLLRISALV